MRAQGRQRCRSNHRGGCPNGAAACETLRVRADARATCIGTWEKRWTKSSWKEKEGEAGTFTLTAGKWYGDAEADKGVQTGPDAKFFAYYSKLDKPYDNSGKDLVVQARAACSLVLLGLVTRSCALCLDRDQPLATLPEQASHACAHASAVNLTTPSPACSSRSRTNRGSTAAAVISS